MGFRQVIYNRNPGVLIYFCRFVYWTMPDFVGGLENAEDAGSGAGLCFLGFFASLPRLI